ncbi:hypothetical protein BY458DRAFT_547826 [Sporodiniella umbellata]|nr:hypothetical protein BY458DRAFT_547826 [Sporodiniella umbellata]
MQNTQEQASLEDRLYRLATAKEQEPLPDFPDNKSDLPSDFEYDPAGASDEEEIVEEMTEDELLKYLDQQEDALTVSQRLFYQELNTTQSQHQADTWLLQTLNAQDLETLYGQGWVELEGLIDLDLLKAAYTEAKTLYEQGSLVPASRVKETSEDPFRDTTARDDAIVWLDPQGEVENKASLPPPTHLQQVLDYLQGPFAQDLKRAIRLNGRSEYQLAYYHPHGAHYDRHRDALPTDDPNDTDQRRLTAVLYLNPGWTSGDGGELKIHGRADGADRYIKPRLGNLLLFLSGVVDHEVMPSKRERFALTSWMR